ncbi:MAG: radical SAM protein [Polyangiaceae bacterium]|nr:radical SAM protein [Polyangiaceae bacterium]
MQDHALALHRDELVAIVSRVHAVRPLHKVRLTGGEPLLRHDIVDIVTALRGALPSTTLALTTNGTRLASFAEPLRGAGLDAVNISLDAVDAERFRALTRGGNVATVLSGLAAAARAGIEKRKLNAVLLASYNGTSLADLVRLAADHGAEARFIELMPSGPGRALHPHEFLSADEALARIASKLSYVGPLGQAGTATRHRLRDGDRLLTVGFITPVSHPFCDGCDRLRLDARARLLACLRSDTHVDLLEPLRNGRLDEVERRICLLLASKSAPTKAWVARNMVAIGG